MHEEASFVSTLGVEWDNQTHQSSVTKIETASLASGDIDEDDIIADQQKYLKDHEMIVDGLKCPDEFIKLITPMEFEELVNLFRKFDADGSGAIDKHEVKKVLLYLNMEASLNDAMELMEVIDVDKSGEIDFDEFCNFIVMLKRGDPRLGNYSHMLTALNSTPLGELERQCSSRNLNIRFEIKEKREATLTQPTAYVIEVQLSGMFHRLEAGETKAEFMVKKFQGLGNTTKEAKYNAAQNAVINLGESMPGVRCQPGEFPDEWMEWMNENLLRGVDPGKVVTILASKGFHPHRNTMIMHRILSWTSLDRFLLIRPELDLTDPAVPFHEDFFEWCKDTAKKGIDGEVILKMLEDRCINLKKDYLHFAQQLENNEMGCLMDKDGSPADILDFWHACKMGYLEDVIIFCKCNAMLDEEKVDRHTSERMTPLSYASANGHAECVRVLLEYGANPRTVDLRGRTPVHHAAMKGHMECCRYLIDGGGMMFSGDLQGNTPLHLAAMNNHYEAMNYLAYKGQELTRLMTSDKVLVKKNTTFQQLSEIVFALVPTLKLSPNDTVRMEKKWLNDAANIFISKMDDNVRHMLAASCDEIMEDVLARFDPRTESTVVLTGRDGEQILVKIVANAGDLAHLLKATFRQTALDSVNSWKRTALHMACDANHINTHEKVIVRMIDFHGCNTSMRDMHDRRPIDLLIKDKFMQNMPSSTQVREELLIDRREDLIESLMVKFHDEDRQIEVDRQQAVLDYCTERDFNCSLRIWHVVREASIFKEAFVQGWEMYEDPDTQNYFYCQKPRNPVMGDTYDHYSWSIPSIAKPVIDRYSALIYQLRVLSTHLRSFEDWEQYRCNKTQIEFYFNGTTKDITFHTPKHLQWRYILKERTPERAQQHLGYGREWEVFQDKYGNIFYRNVLTRLCEYDRPVDAVDVTPADMLCSAYQYKGKASMQEWYSCEQCNRAWKLSSEGTTQVRICAPCVWRCHQGHKGVRLIRYSMVLCICTDVCRVTNCQCNATQISEQQKLVQVEAIDHREEIARHRKRNEDQPPVFTVVPRYDPSGSMKGESGWMICRLCNGADAPSVAGSSVEDAGALLIEQQDMMDGASAAQNSVSDDDSSIQSQSTLEMSMASLGSIAKAKEHAANPNTYIALPENVGVRSNLPDGWREIYDCEEPEKLKYEDRVLCRRYGTVLRKYGRVRSEIKPGFYRIRYEDRSIPDETLERSYLELISRRVFYGNYETGQAAWTSAIARNEPLTSESLTLPGPAWLGLYETSPLRRSFGDWEEYYNVRTEQLFYVNVDNFMMEKAALQLQNICRAKFRLSRPHNPWRSMSFTFDVPDNVAEQKKIKGGWAYLRRRSNNVGEFQDAEGMEWEEYMDKETSEYFYWNEEENLYRWDKPEAFKKEKDLSEMFSPGEEVMYIFPGRRKEEVAVIDKLRFDDETGEDMYDLHHKYSPELRLKWVARMHIKHMPKEGDALMLAKLEIQWVKQLQRKREADDRKAKRDKELAIEEEMKRLAEMKTLAYRLKAGNETGVSHSTRLMRGRVKRMELEVQEIKEEIDLREGKERRDRVQKMVEERRQSGGGHLTRSDVLSITRALELKLQMEDKVKKRNELRRELVAKKKQSVERTVYVEETLRDSELQTTTPRSLVRRRIVRRMHIAMKRQEKNFMICEWGCGDWFRVGKEQADHQLRRCVRRIIGCTLGCPLKHTEEFWLSEQPPGEEEEDSTLGVGDGGSLTNTESSKVLFYGGSFAERAKTPAIDDLGAGVVTRQQHHEMNVCPKRLIMCPKNCLEWVCAELLDKHIEEQCTKRPAKPIECRNGCGCMFGGNVETLIQAENERLMHEQEECELRMVRCNWTFEDGKMCAAQMRACEREEHRDYHLTLQGMITYSVPGTYLYKVPNKLTRLKVQVWGAGGGSGYFYGRQGGNGGGGAFVEAIIDVEPYSVLELVVGSGGGGGVGGQNILPVDIHEQRAIMAKRRDKEIHMLKGAKINHDEDETSFGSLAVIEQSCGVTLGGHPGGGEGYGGAGAWASGGGGGYSIISKRSNKGSQALVVAAGGGGGASLPGLPGGALEGVLPGTLLDPINGCTATVDAGGDAGDSGSTYNAAWPSTAGDNWQGGNGCEFGAGGGGGYFGGGGGGTAPGISGGGGGGSSYLYMNIAHDSVFVMGHQMQPGGLNHNVPQACGVGEWDKPGGAAGQGGMGDPYTTRAGNNGAIRLIKPGHY